MALQANIDGVGQLLDAVPITFGGSPECEDCGLRGAYDPDHHLVRLRNNAPVGAAGPASAGSLALPGSAGSSVLPVPSAGPAPEAPASPTPAPTPTTTAPPPTTTTTAPGLGGLLDRLVGAAAARPSDRTELAAGEWRVSGDTSGDGVLGVVRLLGRVVRVVVGG